MILKTYEALFVFGTSFKDETLETALDVIREEIRKLGGDISSTDVWGRRAFARPMKKKKTNEGIYAKIVIVLDPDRISDLRARMKLNTDVIRVQILRGEEGVIATQVGEVPEEAAPATESPAEPAPAEPEIGKVVDNGQF